ncbi:ABC transporter ATP-binding protein [Nesterenkonia cremea]|uniref:Fe3+/spermidine/putrescine ABC transporter ATP-binding protein n=1 Tax=Nesterenkonia cremea TaxID=1882340 RepID=A0A917AVC7_9MICC|nr:ABC transporter ATP-binding protein [Nesterenkonia cremea]GGE76117.1 Fe3+/spermidine/putrescine ABC transporter ATP-binding protein [Nesterenkonia cremea]
MQHAVQIEGLTKEFTRRDGTRIRAIDDAAITIDPGEFIVLLGPSGCGKTTLLRTIAGLENPDSGRISIDGRDVFASHNRTLVPPEQRDLSMMFQSYALWPHMTVRNNVRYPLETRRRPRIARKEMDRRALEALETVGIGELSGQYPGQLSGGQQQRTALARALVNGSPVILFDEPLSNVDAQVREQLRAELLATQRRLGFTAIFVTHDQNEAMELATRIAVLDQGKVQQVGTPAEIYRNPATAYVATFIGTTNEISGTWDPSQSGFSTDAGPIRSSSLTPETASARILWRPEDGKLESSRPSGPNTFEVTVTKTLFLGLHTEYVVRWGKASARIWSSEHHRFCPGDQAWLSVSPEDVMVFPGDGAQPTEAEAAEDTPPQSSAVLSEAAG